MRAHYTHAISAIFLSQAPYVASHRQLLAIERPGNLPAMKWEKDHGVRQAMRLPVHSVDEMRFTMPDKRPAQKTANGFRLT
jgi:hypothetical protein